MKFPEKESSLIEFAASIPTNDQIIQTTIGFCNSHGGKLIVGVAKNGTIVGIPENKIEVLMECLKQCIYDASCPPIISTVYSQRIGDKMVLIVLVPAGMNKPYFKKSEGLDKGTYIRFGRSTVKANADMIKDLQRQSQCRSFDMMSIHDAKLTDLDEKRIKVFLTREHKETDAITNSILFANDLIIRENTSHYPTAGGILLFGKKLQQ